MRSTGADWKSFNAAQKQVRMDMVWLYGNEKRLIPPKSPFDTAGPEGASILCVFYFQVGALYVCLFVLLQIWQLSLFCLSAKSVQEAASCNSFRCQKCRSTSEVTLQVLEQIYLICRRRYLYPVMINFFALPVVHDITTVLKEQHNRVMALMHGSRLTPLVQEQWVQSDIIAPLGAWGCHCAAPWACPL